LSVERFLINHKLLMPTIRYLASCIFILITQISAVSAADLKDNPLTVESTLPYQYPPFDKIKDEHFVPAIEAGMREQLKEIEPIANNSEEPTFDNTIVALERTGRLLDRAQRTFSNLNACDTNTTRQKIDKETAPKLSAHRDEIFLNPKLFARVQALYDQRDKLGLDPESAYLLERYYKDFVRAGAKLSDANKERLKKINAELATLQTQFEQNVLKERNASSIVVDRKEDLAGLTKEQMASLTAAAKTEHKEGKFVIQLQNTTGQPLLASLQNRHLRERIMQHRSRGTAKAASSTRAILSCARRSFAPRKQSCSAIRIGRPINSKTKPRTMFRL
jgi:peptidyl-dipeptidase Dcp